mgnify:CR=1 FL=1
MRDLWVIKLGGSLFENPLLHDWLSAISEHGKGRAVVVGGGGQFADAVRMAQKQTGFDDVTAHRMALMAMDQSAVMLAGLNPHFVPAKNTNQIDALLNAKQIPIWLPSEMALAGKDIPASWDITSDSLAAWLAFEINATGLVLVKSCDVPPSEAALEKLVQQGVVDPLFPMYAGRGSFRTVLLSGDEHARLDKILATTENFTQQV